MSELTTTLKISPSMTTRRDHFAATVVNGKLCAVGGYGVDDTRIDSIELCDVVNGEQWTQAPSKMNRRRLGCAAAAIRNSVLVAGGHDEKSAEVFNVETGMWRPLRSMSTERCYCVAAAVGDEFFVFGGTASWKPLKTAASFNVKTGWWKDLPPMKNRRRNFAAAVINNKIYIVGGCYDESTIFDTVEVFNLTTRTWTVLPQRMTTRRYDCAAAAVGSHLVVAGGRDDTSTLNTIEAYDVNTETWSELPPMSTKRGGCAAVSLGGSVYIMGGRDEKGRILDSVEEIAFSNNVVKGILVEWSNGSWSNDVSPLLHRRTSVIHKLDINITSMPTLLSRVGQESRVQTIYEILRGEIGVFKHTWRPKQG